MALFDRVKESFKRRNEMNAKDKELQHQIEQELEVRRRTEEREIYEKEYLKQAREAAILRARRDAAKKTGLAKLRALDRVNSLENNRGRPLSRLAKYVQGNIKRREDNLKRRDMIMQAVKEDRMRKLGESQALRARREQEKTQRNNSMLARRQNRRL